MFMSEMMLVVRIRSISRMLCSLYFPTSEAFRSFLLADTVLTALELVAGGEK